MKIGHLLMTNNEHLLMTNKFRQDGVQDRVIEGYLSNTEFMTEFLHNYLDTLSHKEWTDMLQDYLNKTHNED